MIREIKEIILDYYWSMVVYDRKMRVHDELMMARRVWRYRMYLVYLRRSSFFIV